MIILMAVIISALKLDDNNLDYYKRHNLPGKMYEWYQENLLPVIKNFWINGQVHELQKFIKNIGDNTRTYWVMQ